MEKRRFVWKRIAARCGIFSQTLCLLLSLLISSAHGQFSQFGNYLSRNVRLAGQANLYGELYDVQGTARRRPPSTQRLSFSPTFAFSRYFTLSAELLLSSEQSYARQSMNLMGLHPVWKWGRAHLGDYSDSFSSTTFHGVNVKGAEMDLYPGLFRFTAGGGQTKRAVDGNVIHQNYAQYLFASRLGYGKTNTSFIDFIFVKVKDDIASLSKSDAWNYPGVNPDTLENELDSLWVEPPYNPYAVTPQENLILGFCSRIQLLQGRVVLKMEGSGSAYTKNLETNKVEIDSVDMPDFMRSPLGKIFTPRRSSNLDFASHTQLELNLKDFRSEIGYRNIGSGYISLGMPSAVNDREEISFNSSARLGIHRIRLQWNRLSDNLMKQKLVTNVRNQFGAGLNTSTRSWQSSIQVQYLLMGNDAPTDTLEFDFNNLTVSINQSLLFGKNTFLRRMGIQYTLQASDKTTSVSEDKAHYHTVNLTSGFQAARSLSANASAGLSFRKTGDEEMQTSQVYSIRITHAALANKLSSSLFSSSSMIRNTKVFRLGLSSSYRVTRNNQVVLELSHNVFRGAREFYETRGSLMLSHRF